MITKTIRRGQTVFFNEYGQYHSENDEPAIINKNYSCWYINGLIHRDDGPAVICTNGERQWWRYGALHRMDGPAIISPNSKCAYYCYGKQISPLQFWRLKQTENRSLR